MPWNVKQTKDRQEGGGLTQHWADLASSHASRSLGEAEKTIGLLTYLLMYYLFQKEL